MSWYLYLNREQLYQRNYRSHNLWLNFYNQKMRQPKIASFHIALFKRIAKSYSGVSTHFANNYYYLFLTFFLDLGSYCIDVLGTICLVRCQCIQQFLS